MRVAIAASVVAIIILFTGCVTLTTSDHGDGGQVVLGDINSFEGCVEAGYQIMESYPRQCKTPDGRILVEIIDEPIKYSCSDGDENYTLCPDETTTYFSENCVDGKWVTVNYIRNPCEPIPKSEF